MRERTLRLAAVVTFLAATDHAAALTIPAFAAWAYPPGHPPLRHVVFIAINIACGWLLVVRPAWFVVAYAALVVQVLNGHGRAAWVAWRAAKPVYVADVLVSIGVVAILTLLVVDGVQSSHDADVSYLRTWLWYRSTLVAKGVEVPSDRGLQAPEHDRTSASGRRHAR